MSITTEKTFESAIVEHLTSSAGGWLAGRDQEYDKLLALFPSYVVSFLTETQPKQWEKLAKIHGLAVETKLLQRLSKELELRGTLDVIRNGFTDYGVTFRMSYSKPESSLNPDTLALYGKNQLHVTRQLHYSAANTKSLDLLLSVNGLPVATAELKNHFTGQTADNARRQFSQDRDPKETLFQGKSRTLVHFAVDSDEVYMTTKLEEGKTRFLPFNQGNDNAAGNPPNPDGYQTSYLWETIWQRDSWLDIINRFLHIQTETIEDKATGKTHKRERIIFPRYHQLEAVRALAKDARAAGAGKNYLIQHSAGSGKSNSIAWLAYRLFSLHNLANERVFDTIIVITDRKVLDQQLQNTIYQFEHRTGVVQKIDKDTHQLRDALLTGSGIVITTLQKFPFVLESIDRAAKDETLNKAESLQRIASRRYALIVDEAHSSQGGEASRKMKEVLAAASLEEAEQAEDAEQGEDGEDFIRRAMETRGQQPNLSFFAFTATPKQKTLSVFGTPDVAGKPRPFHLYSMRQAIEEGFILDVLANYTTYELYFKLSKAIEDDPELNKKKASIAIGRFVSLHPHNIAQKTEIIIEHFRQVVSKKIGGKAKAMVVTGSRLHALRYYLAFKNYISQKGYTEIKALVAFSGKVIDDLFPEGVTEVQLNGFGEKELPEKFASDDYQLLLVANKYQTGFDQPLLHTMYVDKKLNGVLAVQTLSRLNRTQTGKEDTFVLDFANDRETILASFQPYYELTTVAESTDPNLLYDLKNKLDARLVYWQSEIDGFCNVFFDPASNVKDQKRLYGFTGPAVDRYRNLLEEEQDEFKRNLTQWLRLYAFLSQIMPFQDVALEKLFVYGKYLSLKLPRQDMAERLKLNDEVALDYYRLQKIADNEPIVLESMGEYGLEGSSETGMKRDKEEKAPLSDIINVLNDRYGMDFTEADKLFFDQIEQELVDDQKLVHQAQNNTIDNFRYGFHDAFIDKLIDRMEQNQEISSRILNDKDFGGTVIDLILEKVYKRVNK
ncbi:type I restriction endonuclease subunit R [Spirosoma sp. KUDC1026]|uniref:type I restriction endonuclease subunit R n=1 Tax=Spirosoma sp. KUDC1026 TaxID=2745947 RepID=UPI00159BC097|nr:type I restriction endonuclease [Spirosoma sp. KUDC1026]QKZ12715.1 type I restriction endonuclease subunit R [Spirosoma sp. KUDC1026]